MENMFYNSPSLISVDFSNFFFFIYYKYR